MSLPRQLLVLLAHGSARVILTKTSVMGVMTDGNATRFVTTRVYLTIGAEAQVANSVTQAIVVLRD